MSEKVDFESAGVTVKRNQIQDEAILAMGKESNKWCSRPCKKTFFKMLTYIVLLNGIGAFWLATFIQNSLFWAINEDVFDFDFQALTWIALVACGLVTLSLFISGNALIGQPEWFFRFYSAFFSGIPAVGMIFFAYNAGLQVYHLEEDTHMFCEGGFTGMNQIADSYIHHFYRVEQQYIKRYMCQPGYCPCSKTVDRNSFYYEDREIEFGNLQTDLQSEGATEFYRDCYMPMIQNGQIEEMHEDFLKLLKQIESKHNCAGVCETNLFYFFKSAEVGPPMKNCRMELIEYYKWTIGVISSYGFLHGIVLFIYFIAQFEFWRSYGK